MSTKTYLTTLQLILNEILASLRWQASKARATARRQRDYGSWATRLRLVISMLLMFTLGITTVWGQSGVWYIANETNHGSEDIDTHWYLVPGANPQKPRKADAYFNDYYCNRNGKGDYPVGYEGDSGKPFLTTYQTGQDLNSIWIVISTGDGYYNIIHAKTGKYVVYEPPYLDAPNRKSVHLESTTTPGDNAKFTLTGSLSGPININPESVTSENMYFNPAAGVGNRLQYYGTGDYLHEGMIGLYSGSGDKSQWYFETALFPAPTISVNVESGTFSITTPTPDYPSDYELPSDYSIRYTTGDGTQAAPTATTEDVYTKGEAVRIGNFKNVKAVIVGHGKVLSAVADVDVKCDIPSLTSYDATDQSVVFETATTGATIYYTSTTDGSDPADPTTSNNSGYGSSPLTINDVNGTTKFKAIAVKEGMLPSDVISQIMVVDPTITLSSSSFAYTGSEIKPTVSINDGNVDDIPDTEYGVSYSNNINAGTATVTITNKFGGNYYVIGGSVNFEITTVPLTITANPHTITYGDAPAANGVEYSGFVNNETQSVLGGQIGYTYSYSQFGDVGDYTITPNGLSSDNYAITFNPGTLTVTPKEVGLTWGTTDFTYNGSERTPTATATETVHGDEIGVTVTGGQTAVGSGYIATASALTGAQAGNYKLPEANTTEFTIKKAPLTVTANDHTITYGDAPAADGVTYSGFVNGDNESVESVLSGTVFYGYNYTQFGDVGDYNITPMGLTAANYDISFVTGVLTVTQREVSLTWGNTDLTYNGSEQAPTATATGTVNGDEIGVTVEGATNVGEGYTATALALTGDKATNYKLPDATEDKTTDFSIGKAPLTVTANDLTITYGDDPADTEADAGVTYTGFVKNESESVLTGTLQYNYHYQQYDNVGTGTYSITPSGLNSDNYAITFEDGTLTVIPKEVRITWGETALTYDGTSKVPTAEITPATGDIVNNDVFDDVVTVTASAKEGSELTDGVAINPGYYKATASFTGTKAGNYKPSPSSLTFSISSKSIGDGNEPADGIDISLTQVGSDIVVNYVKDGETTLEEDKDYTVKTETQGFDYYIIVTGKGNYGGSARKLFVKPEFYLYTESGETDEYAAVYRASSDLSNPTGITPYIVKKVNPSLGTINIAPVDYLPKDVPVLMLANTNIQVFEASSKPDNEEAEDYIPVITAETENSNLLKVAPESGVAVEAAQVYMFYKGEFVLIKKGTITEGKFYLYNPNYKANPDEEEEGGGAGARSVLRFVVGDNTGIVDVEMSEGNRTASGNDAWYLLDGRRLSVKPTKQGLYIWNGRKTVINKK